MTEALVTRLYADHHERKKVLESAGATSSALRLAQEFQSAHGRPALIDAVRELIPDEDFVPSTAHEMLMDLNWADVFTTNYDTLLERAPIQQLSEKLRSRRYDTVLDSSDLPLAQRPRVIKLHGSLPNLTNLVLTEDDFRRYPIDQAAYVNTVLASLSENVFCLIGFSGDDPNFLAWTGWIRDVLKESSPPIYLFTCEVFKPFQRRLLEQRNIIPIPIFEVSRCSDYAPAYKWLFQELAMPLGEPTASWNQGPEYIQTSPDDESRVDEPWDPKGGKESWMDAAILWRKHRRDYKGWHVLYRLGMTQLWTSTEFWIRQITSKVIEDWAPPECIFVLRELLWRMAKALQPIPDDLVEHLVDPIVKRYSEWKGTCSNDSVEIAGTIRSATVTLNELDENALFIILELLRHAREIGNGVRFSALKERLTNPDSRFARPNQDDEHFIQHQSLLWTMAHLEHDEARDSLYDWDTTNADAIWTIRRAGLMLECGGFDSGTEALTRLMKRLTPARRSTDIDYVARSSEGLALYLLWYCSHVEEFRQRSIQRGKRKSERSNTGADSGTGADKSAIRGLLKDLRPLGCDPDELLDWLRLLNEDKLPPLETVQESESFDVGRLTRTYRSGNVQPYRNAYRAIRFIEEAGLPLEVHEVVGLNVCKTLYRNAANVIAHGAANEGIGLMLRSRDPKLIDAFLSRENVAALDQEQRQSLTTVGLNALRRAISKLGVPPRPREAEDEWWERQLKCAVLILGRIVVCVDDATIEEIAAEAIRLAGNVSLWSRGVSSEIGELIKRAIRALHADAQKRLIADMLATPIPGSEGFPNSNNKFGRWYDPVCGLDTTSVRAMAARAIDDAYLQATLIEPMREATGRYRELLVLRTASLMWAGFLSKDQRSEFADALFARTDEFGFPADTGCYDNLVLAFPRRRSVSEKELFRAKYLANAVMPLTDCWDNLHRTVVRFGPPRGLRRRSIRWSRTDLSRILDGAELALPQVEAAAKRAKENRVSQSFLAAFKSDESGKLFDYWRCTVEEVVLLAPNAANDHISRGCELLFKAMDSSLATIDVGPTLVCLQRLSEDDVISTITESMTDRDESIVWQACRGIVRWAELTRAEYKPAIPGSLLRTLGTLILGRRQEQLPLLLNTSKDLVQILSTATPAAFTDQILFALEELVSETDYQFSASPFSIARRIRLRQVCVALARALRESGLDAHAIQAWANIGKQDVFAEVRRSEY